MSEQNNSPSNGERQQNGDQTPTQNTRNQSRIPSHLPTPQGFGSIEPQRFILMSPHMVAIGGLIAFFTVVLMVVVLPTATYNPPPSKNWLPISETAFRGRAIYLSNGCIYCHSGFSRPQDVYNAQYYVYSRVSEPGDYYGESQSPNILGSERTGPDQSQEGGNHPDDWHMAHYWNPRSTTPLSIMQRFNFLSDQQRNELIAFTQSQGGKEGTLRYAAETVGKQLMMTNMGMVDPLTNPVLSDLAEQTQSAGQYKADGKGMEKSPSGMPWMAVWMLNSFERGYWLTPDPLALTQQNLLKGRQVFMQRCAGCHGAQGNGNGPAAQFLMPKPFDFTDQSMTGINGFFASDGDMYHRMLTAGKGSAMENFGTRLSVDDMWRVVLFLRTIQNGGLTQPLPTVEMYKPWQAPPQLMNYISTHPIGAAPAIGNTQIDPFMAAARWLAPGMAPEDTVLVGGKLPVTLDGLAGTIRATYMRMAEQAYNDAKARGEELPPKEQIMSTDGVTFHMP